MGFCLLRFIIASIVFSYIWFRAPQSKLGYPGFYWEQGFLPFLGFIALLISLFFAVFSAIGLLSDESASDSSEKSDPEDIEVMIAFGHFFGIVGMIITQILPEPPNGVQFLPSRDAVYISPFATKLWIVCWLSLVALAFTYFVGNRQSASASLLIVLSLGFCLSFFTKKQDRSESLQRLIAQSSISSGSAAINQNHDAKALLETNKRQREKMSATLQILQSDYRKIAPASFSMKPSDRSTSRDRMDQQLNAERQELELQISQLESDVERLDETILGLESVMRRKERQRLVRDQGLLRDADYEALLKKFLLLSGEPGVSAAK